MKMKQQLFFGALMLMLGGCADSTTLSDWSCPSPGPNGCFDVQSSDQLALDVLSSKDAALGAPLVPVTVEIVPDRAAEAWIRNQNIAQLSHKEAMPAPRPIDQPARIPEEIAKVWLGPFVDEDGHYHTQRWIFVQIRPPSWSLR